MLAGVVLAVALTLELPAAPTARVNDYAGLLAAADRQRLESAMAARERATGAQMAIAIFRSLATVRLRGGAAPSTIEEFSIKLAEQWRIGQKGLDNGVILVLFVDDRKLRLEVGYGLEAVVPDIEAGRIIREVIAPPFREQRYAAGLEAAVQAVYARIETGPEKAQARRAPTRGSWPLTGFGFLIVIVVILLAVEASRSRRFVGRRGYTAGHGGWSGPIFFPGGGGGRGGGGSGGGFSGGGGNFGGGGASGSW